MEQLRSEGGVRGVFTEFESLKEADIPFLCEMWNWEGDLTVLPHKWAEVLNEDLGEEVFDSKQLKENFVQKPEFDPLAFFFITSRSNALGSILSWPTNEPGVYDILNLASKQSRTEGVEKALVLLSLNYLKKKGAKLVEIRIGTKVEARVEMLKEVGFVFN